MTVKRKARRGPQGRFKPLSEAECDALIGDEPGAPDGAAYPTEELLFLQDAAARFPRGGSARKALHQLLDVALDFQAALLNDKSGLPAGLDAERLDEWRQMGEAFERLIWIHAGTAADVLKDFRQAARKHGQERLIAEKLLAKAAQAIPAAGGGEPASLAGLLASAVPILLWPFISAFGQQAEESAREILGDAADSLSPNHLAQLNAEPHKLRDVACRQIHAAWPILSHRTAETLTRALAALSAGEIMPLVKPARSNKQQPALSLTVLKLAAMYEISRLEAVGWDRKDAEQRMADACGVTLSLVRSWAYTELPGMGLSDLVAECRREMLLRRGASRKGVDFVDTKDADFRDLIEARSGEDGVDAILNRISALGSTYQGLVALRKKKTPRLTLVK